MIGPGRVALGIAFGYLAAASLWILLSDRALGALVKEQEQLERFQTFKGVFFVLVTSVLLWLTLRTYLRQVARDVESRLAAERARAEAEEALRHSRENFAKAFEHNPAAIALTRLSDGRVLAVNATWEKLFGYRREEVIGKSLRHMWKDAAAAGHFVRELSDHGSIVETDQEVTDRSGQTVVIDLTARMISLDGEEIVLSTLLDVRQRRREQAARERQQRRVALLADISHRLVVAEDPRSALSEIFRALVQELEVDIFAHYAASDGGDRLILANSAGLSDEQKKSFAELCVGQSLCGLVAQRRVPLLFAELPSSTVPQAAGIIALGVKAYSGHPLVHGDRLIGTISFGSRRREHYDADDVRLMQAVADQISAALDRMRLLEALQANELRFRQMAESISDVFWMVEVGTYSLLYVSPAYERIWGRSLPDLLANPTSWMESIVPEDRDRVTKAVARQHQMKYREEYRIRRPDGTVRWILDTGFPVRDANGKVYRVAGVARDITETKQLEEQFLRSQRMEAVGTLASGVAHDLNNILAPVMMVGGLLRRKYTETEDHKLLGLVEQAAHRGAAIVAQLLTFGRGLGGEKIDHRAEHLVKEIAHLLQETFPRNIAISQNHERDLPNIRANPTQIHQVLMNLCVNARDAMPDGGRLELGLRRMQVSEAEAATHETVRPGTFVVLSVSDTGQGIAPEFRSRVFDPFFTTKEVGKGTGLGLATVVAIVRGHGGFVKLETECGRGSKFEVFLPASDANARPAPAPREDELPQGQGECLLVVDDEKSVRVAMRELLQSRGFRVLEAADAATGLDLLRRHGSEVRLVITDYMMPGMDGLALAAKIRTATGVPVIVCSGAGTQVETSQLKAAGIQQALSKPLSARTLLDAVTQALR